MQCIINNSTSVKTCFLLGLSLLWQQSCNTGYRKCTQKMPFCHTKIMLKASIVLMPRGNTCLFLSLQIGPIYHSRNCLNVKQQMHQLKFIHYHALLCLLSNPYFTPFNERMITDRWGQRLRCKGVKNSLLMVASLLAKVTPKQLAVREVGGGTRSWEDSNNYCSLHDVYLVVFRHTNFNFYTYLLKFQELTISPV